MKEKILITGGSGLVGKELTKHLQNKGYSVAHLSRSRSNSNEVTTFIWDIKNKFIEPAAVTFPDYIIHLAGAGLFDQPWTPEFKKEIIESRVKSAELLFEELQKANHKIKGFISASGISIYGPDTKDLLVSESSKSGKDFLANVVEEWEAAADKYKQMDIRTVKIRIGIVLSTKGGALTKILTPIRLGIGAPLGSGNQYFSWIHIKDICNIFQFAIENANMEGAFNATSPNPCTNKTFTLTAGRILNKKIWLPPVPGVLLKIALGKEKALLALGGNRVSSKKLQEKGYKFLYPELVPALQDLINNV